MKTLLFLVTLMSSNLYADTLSQKVAGDVSWKVNLDEMSGTITTKRDTLNLQVSGTNSDNQIKSK